MVTRVNDFTSCIAVSYVVYLLLCLKDPAQYYGKPKNDAIDILNIAINADQAQRVFFKGFLNRVKNNPWFEGRYIDKTHSIEFDKNITVYSGHSEREAFEGLNAFMVILDEIAGFALESKSGNHNAKTADAIYKMHKGAVTSRFAEYGKVVLLSFVRFKDDYIDQKYQDAIHGDADEHGQRPMLGYVEQVKRHATLKVNPELPDGVEGNEFDINWTEDHIHRYAYPYVFALRRPSWEVNPTKDLQRDYALDFYRDPSDAMGRFACEPSQANKSFFKNHDKIDTAFSRINGVDHAGVFYENFKPIPEAQYYMHVDLAQKHDHCAVSMAHVERWIEYPSKPLPEFFPVVSVDFVRWWTPTASTTVDFQDVINFIREVRRKGFNIKLVTFDRWNSLDTMNALERLGIETNSLSIVKPHYDDFLITMYDDRLVGPREGVLIDELKALRRVMRNGKEHIDHPSTNTKDLSDAVCGSIWNAVKYTPYKHTAEVGAYTLSDLRKQVHDVEEIDKRAEMEARNVIVAPSIRDAPIDVQELLARLLKAV